MDGIMDGELVLGVWPENYREKKYLNRRNGLWCTRWIDDVTGERQRRDPRHIKLVKEGEEPGKIRIGTSSHYPFMTSERLKDAGMKVRSFDLI